MDVRAAALLSRKFVLAMFTVSVTAGLVVAGILDQTIYSTVIIAVVGGYITGNVAQKATAK